MAQRFAFAAFAFVSMVLLTTFTLALLMAPARPAPLERPGCERNLAEATATMQEAKARMKKFTALHDAQACAFTRQLFLEVVKARAVTALCRNGADRDRELGRLDADVDQINNSIAETCG